MYERLKRLYTAGRITIAGLKKAVINALISEYEFEAITGEPYIRETDASERIEEEQAHE